MRLGDKESGGQREYAHNRERSCSARGTFQFILLLEMQEIEQESSDR
jgi:hypothetical protein